MYIVLTYYTYILMVTRNTTENYLTVMLLSVCQIHHCIYHKFYRHRLYKDCMYVSGLKIEANGQQGATLLAET